MEIRVPPHFSPTFAAGGFVFVSGQLAFGADGEIRGDVVAQTRQCLANLEELLAARGLRRSDVVKATVWIRQAEDYDDFNRTYAEFFGNHLPSRSTLVCDLARPEAVVEIEAIAMSRTTVSPRS